VLSVTTAGTSGRRPAGGPPSGAQWTIRHAGWEAVVVEVGGGIRVLRAEGRDVLQPYAEDAMCDGAHGTPLVPWPNRLGDGRYTFVGRDLQLPLSEPATATAIHGLLRWDPWLLRVHDDDRVVVGQRIHPRTGYPFDLDVACEYRLDGAGLTVTTTATNLGPTALPFAAGQHPYLSPGSGPVDACVLTVEAQTRVLLDERGLPVGTADVAGGPYDFAGGREIGALVVDVPLRGLARDGDGRAWTRLRGPDGATVSLWQDRSYEVLQLFTGDTLSGQRRRTALAAEPMTAPPDAFRTGDLLQRLEPGAATTATWGVTLT
jgi:aldose 1-epimerase